MSLPVSQPSRAVVSHNSQLIMSPGSPDSSSLSVTSRTLAKEDEMLRKLVNQTLSLYDLLQEEKREIEDAKLAVSLSPFNSPTIYLSFLNHRK